SIFFSEIANATDILLAIKPQHMHSICNRSKNFEYRKYRLPPSTLRIWFFETTPVQAITFVATIGPVHVPGQVQDPTGLGNDDFDAGLKKSKFGYPIYSIHYLPYPVSTSQLQAKYYITPPHSYRIMPAHLQTDLSFDSLPILFDKQAEENDKSPGIDLGDMSDLYDDLSELEEDADAETDPDHVQDPYDDVYTPTLAPEEIKDIQDYWSEIKDWENT